MNVKVKLINSDFISIEEFNLIVEQNYSVFLKDDVTDFSATTNFNIPDGKYNIFGIFSSKGLSYITPKVAIIIPGTSEVTLDISQSEIDDVLVDPA